MKNSEYNCSHEQEVMVVIFDNPNITMGGISEKIGMPRSSVHDCILWLVGSGFVDRKKQGRTWHYTISNRGQKVAPHIKNFQQAVIDVQKILTKTKLKELNKL